MWIKRDISAIFEDSKDYVQVVRGPRQCGKSSLILKLDPSFKEISLDDPSLRDLAQNDPELLLNQFKNQKLFIDEVQYAPNLFPSIKRRADLYKRENPKKRETFFRIAGSNQILLEKNVKESLAGRASVFDMNTLSVSEILSSLQVPVQEILFKGGWPELYATEGIKTRQYLDNYINTYVEKDVVLTAGIQKSMEFMKFLRLLAGRTGQLLDVSSFGGECGVDSKTISNWISVLEKMNLIALVYPYSTNLSSRLIKSPKVFFMDTGLACRLQGWGESEPILTSPQQGGLFENLVFVQLHRIKVNFQMDFEIFHWRSRVGEEIDFLLDFGGGKFFFLEAKVSAQNPPSILEYPEVKKVFKNKVPKIALCHQEGNQVLGPRIPVSCLQDEILRLAKN